MAGCAPNEINGMVIRNPAQDPVVVKPFTQPKLMTIALGYSVGRFTPASPDRLCRGRERWITAPSDRVGEELQRIVITAARFDDDSSKNAKRGLSCADVALFDVLRALFPSQRIVACAEDTTAQSITEGAQGVERYVMNRPFRPVQRWFARWEMDCESSTELEQAFAAGATVFMIAPQLREADAPELSYSDLPPAIDEDANPSRLTEEMRQALFYLTGGRTGPNSFGQYQPTALFDLLSQSEAVVLIHRDKHAECLGVYVDSKEKAEGLANSFVSGVSNVTVPFSIPPMLARWDRAIWELQNGWNEDEQGPFPLPAALAESGSPIRSRSRQSGPNDRNNTEEEVVVEESAKGEDVAQPAEFEEDDAGKKSESSENDSGECADDPTGGSENESESSPLESKEESTEG